MRSLASWVAAASALLAVQLSVVSGFSRPGIQLPVASGFSRTGIKSPAVSRFSGTETVVEQSPVPGQIVTTQGTTSERQPGGTVRGQVISTDGRPLRRAQVTLVPMTMTPGLGRTMSGTNGQGRFEMKGVPPGSYNVMLIRSGYMPMIWGEHPLDPYDLGRGYNVTVADGQTIDNLTITMPRSPAITGRVLDERGQPLADVTVIALRARFERGRPVRFPEGGVVRSNASGEFRLLRLFPGSYYISAQSTELWPSVEDRKQLLTYALTFYPGALADRAEPITVGAGETVTDVTFKMQVSRVRRISGRVEERDGTPIAGARLIMLRAFPGTSVAAANTPTSETTTRADGTFEFANVAPGDYRVNGSGGVAVFSVTDADIAGLRLVRPVGSDVSGSIVTEDGGPPPFPPTNVRTALNDGADGALMGSIRSQEVMPNWRFFLNGHAGSFLLRLTGLPAGWMLKSVEFGGRDYADTALFVPPDGSTLDGVRIVVTQKIGTVSGTVQNIRNEPVNQAVVIVFAQDPSRWEFGSRWVQMTRPDAQGRFRITNLPGGDYFVATKPDVVTGEWQNRDYLERLRAEGKPFRIDEGGSVSLQLRQ